jgi:glucan 1,4-alpha-maltotetraohydrolase
MKFKRYLLTAATSVAVALIAGTAAAADVSGKDSNGVRNHGGDEVGIQLFHWNSVRDRYNNWYNDINTNADLLKKLGITMVWMPPPWRDDSSWSSGSSYGGGEGYFWKDFTLDSRYGTDAQLKTAVSTLASTSCSSCSGSAPNNSPDGIKVIYDIVPNHRDYGRQTTNTWAYSSSNKWIKNAYSGGDGFISGDADVNVYNALSDFTGAMNTLANSDHKAAGWRFDFVRGFDAGLINSMMQNTGLDNGFCVGELWKDGYFSASSLSSWAASAGCTAFDFAGIYQSRTGVLSNVRYGMAGSSDTYTRSRAVHAYDNHDLSWSPGTPSGGQSHWKMADSLREPLTVYQTVAPGTPMFYLPYLIDGTNTATWSQGGMFGVARDGIAIRKDAGIKANSAITWYNSEGLQFMVQGTQKKVIGLIWTAVTTPNGMNSSYDNSKYTLALSGSWGKIYVENVTTTPVTQPDANVAPVTVLKYNGSAVTSGSSMNVVNNTALSFDGSGSSDTAGQTLSYSWTCDDLATTAANDCASGWWSNATTSSKSFTPNVNGSYKVTLKVTDNATTPLSSTSAVTINVMTTLPLTSKLAAAYISGTNNNWGTTGMTLTANNLWKATVAFTNVTGTSSGARFKIRPSSSSWSGAYGCTSNCTTSTSGTAATTGGDIIIPSAQGAGSFVLTFNDSTLAWSLTKEAAVAVTVTAIDTYTNSACTTATGTITEGNTIYLKPTTTGTITSSKFVYGSTIIGSSSSGNLSCQAWVVPAVGSVDVSYTANTSSLTKTLTVVNAAPTANAGADQAKKTTQAITLSGAASSDVQGSLVKYTWSESGTEIGLGSSLTLAARAAGTYTFSLLVDDGEGATASDSVVVTVTTNAAPTANAGADVSKTTAESITGTGTDTDGTIASYLWKEGSTTVCTTATCSMAGLSVGTHTLTLTVTDNDGATSSGDDVVVTVTSATASVTFTCNSVPTVNAGEAVFIAGDHSVLGSWAVPTSTAAGQKLATVNGSSRSGTVTGLPVSAARAFKCVIAPSGGGTIRVWGSGANQSVTTGAAGSTVTKTNNFNN